MESRLQALFDFQKFQGSKRLSRLIAEAEENMAAELTDDDLCMVSAAGEIELSKNEDTCNDI